MAELRTFNEQLRLAYLHGFASSGEGYNGEYWNEDRDQQVEVNGLLVPKSVVEAAAKYVEELQNG